jgi:hypothetical protein
MNVLSASMASKSASDMVSWLLLLLLPRGLSPDCFFAAAAAATSRLVDA